MKRNLFARIKRKLFMLPLAVSALMAMSVSALAVEDTSGAVIDPALFDSLVTGVTSNISALLPKVLIVVAMLVGIGIAIALFKKHAKPS